VAGGDKKMISFRFNEKKTTQAAALFIKKHGKSLNYTKLIKLLYLADREALSRWGRPLTGDSYVSMPKGPVLSQTYDLINYPESPGPKSYWHRFIQKKAYVVSLKEDPDEDELSRREIALIEELVRKYRNKSWGQMIDICHECCPEWQDPGKTSVPIRIEDILRKTKKSQKEIDRVKREASELAYFDSILPKV